MSDAAVQLERIPGPGGGDIVVLRFARPDTMNAISRELQAALDQSFAELAADRSVRAVILIGSGRAFCAGADLKERATMSAAEVDMFLANSVRIFSALEDLPAPTIAAINGFALGGGLELALCCDLRLAAADVQLGLPETSLGIIPGAGGTVRLSRAIGPARAKELIFTAARIPAARALELGLVQAVVAAQDLLPAALELARNIAKNAPIALAAAKRAINGGLELEKSAALKLERECYESTLNSRDRQEALSAFREKRAPIFTGE